MNAVSLIISGVSLVLLGMSLSLAIVANQFHRNRFISWMIVFISCLLGINFMSFANIVTGIFMEEKAAYVFDFIFVIFQDTIMAFVVYLIPFYANWILELDLKPGFHTFHTVLGVIYFAIGLVSKIIHIHVLAVIVQTSIMIFVVIKSIAVLWLNTYKLEDEHARNIAKATSIVTVVLVPTAFVFFVFPKWTSVAFPVYTMAVSIITFVYFFTRFEYDSKRTKFTSTPSAMQLSKYGITERENKIVSLICEGMTNKDIGAELGISVNTVNNHVANIFEKMGVKSRVDLLRKIQTGPWS